MDVIDILKTNLEMRPLAWDHKGYYLLVNNTLYKQAKKAIKSGEKGFEEKDGDMYFLGQKIVKYTPPKF